MIFLPIVERELRVRSRQGWTYYLRCGAAGIALLVAMGFLLTLNSGSMIGMAGQSLLYWLTWLAFAGCIVEGTRTTSDCLSGERREGTLGLLFLTSLKGYDVVLGKLAAGSLHSLYGLMAIVPVLALAFLMGGVTGWELTRISLALLATLFFTLSVGIWVSSRNRDEQKAQFVTLGLVVLAAGGLPFLDVLLMKGNYQPTEAALSLGSPAIGCWLATDAFYRSSPDRFWQCLAVTQGLGCLLLVWAGQRLQTGPLDEPERVSSSQERKNRRLLWTAPGGVRMNLKPWLRDRPVLALCTRSQGLFRGILMLLIVNLAGNLWSRYFIASGFRGGSVPTVFFVISYLNVGIHLGLRLLMAALACRFFLETRRSGMLELIMTSPLSREEVLRGQWEALRRYWLWPVLIATGVQVTVLFAFLYGFGEPRVYSASLVSYLLTVPMAVLEFFSLGWVGMWLAYSSRKPGTAVLKTFSYVVLLPWMLCTGFPVWILLARMRGPIAMMQLTHPLISLAINVGFIYWARTKLRHTWLGRKPELNLARDI